ncbi:Cytochrome P450 89A9 [Platanthera zijinensis]|uniref:Cytochrome P450 89A9 n=1 Tax=Platanthera zijinensis TaxID=2320716 RepID=A0AAP0B817_9ASPA
MELNASLILISLSFTLLFLKHVLQNHQKKQFKNKYHLPPFVSPLPVLTHIFLHRCSIFEVAPILRRIHSHYGVIFSLRLIPFSNPSIFISDASLAHSALIHHGVTFSSRPLFVEPNRFLSVGGYNISTAPYGSLWRILRRNLTAETLHPSRIRLFSPGRHWALRVLLEALHSQSDQIVTVKENFKQSILSLLAIMCFGKKLNEREIHEIASLQLFLLRTFTSFNVFAIIPAITKFLFHKRWEEIICARRKQADIFLPMIRARRDWKQSPEGKQSDFEYCYADSLLDIHLPNEGGRGLTDDEMVSLCHEFLSAGVDTTTTALEWTMAELVKNQSLQSKLLIEIESLTGSCNEEIIKEEDLQRMLYLKAVVMESLRRHPPGHFMLPHSVTEDVIVDGFLIPKGVQVLFAVADVNWDGRKWEEPMEFRPERFMAGGYGEEVDITGTREIKMMTFGAGRRMCPGYGLAILHLEFFVANLVREFVWKSEVGNEVDLSEKLEFTTIMENPLRAQLIPRRKK